MKKDSSLFRRLTGAVLVASVVLFTVFSKELLDIRGLYISISVLFGAHLVIYAALVGEDAVTNIKSGWKSNFYGKIRLVSVFLIVIAVATQFISLYIGAPVEVFIGALAVVITAVSIWFVSGVVEEYGNIPGILTTVED